MSQVMQQEANTNNDIEDIAGQGEMVSANAMNMIGGDQNEMSPM